jgi:citrate lyase subunit beta/citryl-CoA lyase
MDIEALKLCRSLLFLPASNLRAIEKARELEADLIVLDCEDSVKPEDKALGRAQAVEAAAIGFRGKTVRDRMNGHGTPYYEEDVLSFRHSAAPFVILPKVEDKAQAATLRGSFRSPCWR